MRCIGIGLIWLLALAACSEEEVAPPPELISEVTAFKNGEPWTNISAGASIVEDCSVPELGMNVAHTNEAGSLREMISIIDIPLAEKRFEVRDDSVVRKAECNDQYANMSLSFWISDGDVRGGRAELDSTQDNWVDITRYDTVKQELWGKFQGTFLHNDDTLRFTEGEFHVTVKPDTRGKPGYKPG